MQLTHELGGYHCGSSNLSGEHTPQCYKPHITLAVAILAIIITVQ